MAILLVLAVLAGSAIAGPGDHDGSYADHGAARLSGDTRLLAAAQRKGKLVAVGERGQQGGNVRLIVVRLNRDGSPDPSFSPGGQSAGGGTFLGPRAIGHAVAIERDGDIVVAGTLTDKSGGGSQGMLVMRLKPNGRLDRSFSGDGKAMALTRERGEANALALRGGKVVLAGSATLRRANDAFPRTAVARFNSNGSRDRHFGSRGTRVLDFGRISVANAVIVGGDGKIVLAGSQRDNLQTTNVLAARLTKHGSPDRSFGGNVGVPGLFVRQYAKGGGYSAAFDVVAGGGGKVILAGSAVSSSVGSTAIALRLRRGGAPDRSFGHSGLVRLRATQDSSQFSKEEPLPGANAVALSGRDIVLGGYYDVLSRKKLALWALRPGGGLDRSFGNRGRTITAVGGENSQLRDLVAGGSGLYGVGDLSSLFDPPRGIAVRYRPGHG
jgi:uncharacterized delta-60 repeat protein